MTSANAGRDDSDDLAGNFDALAHDADDLERLLDDALDGGEIDQDLLARIESTTTGLSYEEITDFNLRRRRDEGWGEPDLLALLGGRQREQLDQWRIHDRLAWTSGDLGAVGTAGLFGVLAAVFDSELDASVLSGLRWLKHTDLLQRWETQAVRLPIDYTGPHFGGPAHRVRSAGHDIGRIFNALSQIRNGVFRGVRWEDGVKLIDEVTVTPSGQPYSSGADPFEALALLMKHLAADFVTPMGLPLPGWTLLYEVPNRDLRKFAHDAYSGLTPGRGLNLRSGMLTPQLGMWVTELIIRTHVHLDAYRESGSAALTPAGRAKRTELLLAAHALAGAASLTKVAAAALVEAPLAVRHVNVLVLMRAGHLAVQLQRDRKLRAEYATPTWQRLWAEEVATWELDEAVALADLLGTTDA